MCTGSSGVGVRCGAVRVGQYLRDARPLFRSEFLDVCDDLRGTVETPTHARSMRHVTSTHMHKMQRATSIQRSEAIRVHTTLSPAPLSASACLSCAHFRDEQKKEGTLASSSRVHRPLMKPPLRSARRLSASSSSSSSSSSMRSAFPSVPAQVPSPPARIREQARQTRRTPECPRVRHLARSIAQQARSTAEPTHLVGQRPRKCSAANPGRARHPNPPKNMASMQCRAAPFWRPPVTPSPPQPRLLL